MRDIEFVTDSRGLRCPAADCWQTWQLRSDLRVQRCVRSARLAEHRGRFSYDFGPPDGRESVGIG